MPAPRHSPAPGRSISPYRAVVRSTSPPSCGRRRSGPPRNLQGSPTPTRFDIGRPSRLRVPGRELVRRIVHVLLGHEGHLLLEVARAVLVAGDDEADLPW